MCPPSPQTLSAAYRLAFRDHDFLLRDELRPVLIFGRTFWERVVHFEALAEEGTITAEDIELFRYVETTEEAWAIISETYPVVLNNRKGDRR
ncbi:MAG: hypothetical protein HY892_14865 [Deltaproteobacteria bacterium]|nr:hypothetical protein [Deltaproteobacteria bacterium]